LAGQRDIANCHYRDDGKTCKAQPPEYGRPAACGEGPLDASAFCYRNLISSHCSP
jgi:hypothetical protein